MTSLCDEPDGAWNELDRMLRIWAMQVESGREMNQNERLEIFSGPNGRFKNVLENCSNKKIEMDALAAAKKT
jgi:hypothetical protein